MLRLDKLLSDAGFGSRSQVRELLKKGLVTVDGKPVTAPDRKTDPEQEKISVNGTELRYRKQVYYLLHKPSGYITAREDGNAPVVMELLPGDRKNLSPVGRLDKDTEGVLLITDDGELCHRLVSPKYHVVKTYYAELSSDLPKDAAECFSQPMVFSDFTAKPAENFTILTERSALLSITEGKFHQVKRMFGKLGCEVTYLRRDSFAGLTLEDLPRGAFRELREEEVLSLKRAAGLME